MKYIYLGDRHTAEEYKRQTCEAVKRKDGKCIRGKTGTMLVTFNGVKVNVIGRLLRKVK